MSSAKPYADPYLAGTALGVVLLASFVLAGRGLGASGAFADALALDGRSWLLHEIGGVLLGGFLSAWLAGRVRVEVERGPRMERTPRLAAALGGGVLMGIGAVLARGCTSGLALTGGSLLAVGSWLFMLSAFAAAYLAAPLVKRAWR
ncbi:MAG TPA: YeeE/YedE thiosulfate transporter family protein [Thermoanaerobaculia bacterium]